MQASRNRNIYAFRTMPKDVGVLIALGIALLLAWGLRAYTENRTTTFRDDVTRFSLSYPATWGRAESLKAMLKLEDIHSTSTFKTALSVDARELDLQNPPTLQALTDRRVAQQGSLTGYHLLSTADATVNGARATRLEYAYVVQPIEQARRASLPVVVHAIEYLVVGRQNAFYITLAAAESDFDRASAEFEQIMRTVVVP